MERKTSTKETTAEQKESSDLHRPAASERGSLHPVHQLQGALGNRALGEFIQAKLKVSQPGDAYEQEADRVADHVMRMPDSTSGTAAISDASQAAPQVSRLANSDVGVDLARKGTDSEEEEEAVQLKEIGGAQPASKPLVGQVSGGGEPMESSVRSFFEPRFGQAFDDVRIHTGGQAAESARSVNAHAYTLGKDIVFNEGTYAPETEPGRRLLAHELTHTIQQGESSALQTKLLQRDLAVEPTVANPAEVVLTAANIQRAIRVNLAMFTDLAEIAIVRDVLGIPKEPSLVDEDFVNAVVRYQSGFGLTPDGMLGPQTSGRLSQEITAEADGLGEPATGTPMRRVARRLHLRSLTSRTLGTMTHQGFVGPDDNPEGAVTVRIGDREGGMTNEISMEYTGENSDAVDWLQFINMQMFGTPPAVPPAAAARVFNTGVVGTTGGPVTWSDAANTHWFVDSVPGAVSPLYNVSGFQNTRAAGRRIAMFDEPGGASGLPVAQAFTGVGALAAGAPTVTMRMRFDSYAVRNNRARYHVAWIATTTYDITAGTSSAIVYTQMAAGSVAGLQAAHRTALLAEFAGNPIR